MNLCFYFIQEIVIQKLMMNRGKRVVKKTEKAANWNNHLEAKKIVNGSRCKRNGETANSSTSKRRKKETNGSLRKAAADSVDLALQDQQEKELPVAT